MRFLLQDQNRTGVPQIFQLLLDSLLSNLYPVVFSGETGFPFLFFLDYSRKFRIPFSISSRLLSASAVNMHHVYSILLQIYKMDADHFPVFIDFSRHYLDENVSDWSSRSLFQRDLNMVSKLEHSQRPVLFYESGRGKSTNRHPFFRKQIYLFSEVCISLSAQKTEVKKFSLPNLSQESSNGSANHTFFSICSTIVPGLEQYSKIPKGRRPEVFRSILSDSQPQHTSGESTKPPVSDGDGLFSSDP